MTSAHETFYSTLWNSPRCTLRFYVEICKYTFRLESANPDPIFVGLGRFVPGFFPWCKISWWNSKKCTFLYQMTLIGVGQVRVTSARQGLCACPRNKEFRQKTSRQLTKLPKFQDAAPKSVFTKFDRSRDSVDPFRCPEIWLDNLHGFLFRVGFTVSYTNVPILHAHSSTAGPT